MNTTVIDRAAAERCPASADELATLERRIATTAARSDIETYCAVAESHCPRGGSWNNWYDTAAVSSAPGIEAVDEERQAVADAVRYLDLLHLLDHTHRHPTWVRIRKAS